MTLVPHRCILALCFSVASLWGCAETASEPLTAQDVGGDESPTVIDISVETTVDTSEPDHVEDVVAQVQTFPSGSAALMGTVSGAGTIESPHYRLRLSVGAPLVRGHRSCPSFQLQLAAPWPSHQEPP